MIFLEFGVRLISQAFDEVEKALAISWSISIVTTELRTVHEKCQGTSYALFSLWHKKRSLRRIRGIAKESPSTAPRLVTLSPRMRIDGKGIKTGYKPNGTVLGRGTQPVAKPNFPTED